MVGGEYSTENDSTKGSARALVSKPLAPSVAKKQPWDIFVLDKRFALIDEYIAADHFVSFELFACNRAADHTLPGVRSPHLGEARSGFGKESVRPKGGGALSAAR
jgi:hypothetical protein